MTLQKKYIEDKDGNKVLPITHQSAVKDDNGTPLDTVIENIEDDLDTVDSRISTAVSTESQRAQGAESALDSRVDDLEDAVGTGGSIDERIAAAVEDCAYIGENDGTAVIADFDPQTDTVWKKAQTLSNAEKSQVKTNLGLPQEIYSKTEVNGLITTPNQQYVTVATYASLPATGSADTVYRVSNYNGSTNQVDATMYSEYAWNGSDYTFLCVKSQVGEVFDITAYNSNTKYADLAAALGTNGANVPEGVRKGGMSVKYVSNSDNKYVQWRLMAQNFSTTVSDWQGVDDVPTAGSDNLVKSGGIKTYSIDNNEALIQSITDGYIFENIGYIKTDGTIQSSDANWVNTGFIKVREGQKYNISIPQNIPAQYGYDIAFYDSSFTFVSGMSAYKVTEVTIPSGISYIMFSGNASKTNIAYYDRIYELINLGDIQSKEMLYQLLTDGYVFNNVGYVKTDGSIDLASDWVNTGFIKVREGQTFSISILSQVPVAYGFNIAFYDSSFNFISGSSPVSTLTITSGVSYIICSGRKTDNNTLRYDNNSIAKLNKDVTELNTKQETLGIEPFELYGILLNVTNNKYVANGTEHDANSVCFTDYIPVEYGQKWVMEDVYLYAFLLEFYDGNKTYISTKTEAGGGGDYEEYEFTVDNTNAKYMRINMAMSGVETSETRVYLKGYKGKTLLKKSVVPITNILNIDKILNSNHDHNIPKFTSLQSGNTLLAFGDSITYGYTSTSSYDAGNVGKIEGEQYCENPYIKIVSDKFRMTLMNYASSGATCTQVQGRTYMYDRIIAAQPVEANLIIIAIGVNDYMVNNANLGSILDVVGSEPSTTSFYGEFNKACLKIKELWPSADVMCITPINYLGASETNSLDKFRDAIIELSTIHGFGLICGEKLGFPIERDVYSDLTIADNLHPTALGHKLMGNAVSNLLDK